MASTLVSALETRLKNRLGLATTVAIGDSRILEAMNAGISRAYSDGVPGLTARTVNGYIYSEFLDTIAAHTAETSALTFTSTPSYIFPGDVLTVSSKDYLVHTVDRTTKIVDVGIPIEASQATNAVTVKRRSIAVPDSTVYGVRVGDSVYEASTRVLLFEGVDRTGAYTVGYSAETGETYVSISPAPTEGTEITVMLRGLKDRVGSSDSLDMPEAVFDAILERARDAYLAWSGDVGRVEAATARSKVEETNDQLTGSSKAREVSVRV